MIVGAFIGGATSEGGGAVAFPVMTLALALEPRVARDFVYVSQSVGWFYLCYFTLEFLIKYSFHLKEWGFLPLQSSS